MVLTPKDVIHLKFNCTSPTKKEMDFRIKHKPRLFFFNTSCIPEASMVLEKSLNGTLCEEKFFSVNYREPDFTKIFLKLCSKIP